MKEVIKDRTIRERIEMGIDHWRLEEWPQWQRKKCIQKVSEVELRGRSNKVETEEKLLMNDDESRTNSKSCLSRWLGLGRATCGAVWFKCRGNTNCWEVEFTRVKFENGLCQTQCRKLWSTMEFEEFGQERQNHTSEKRADKWSVDSSYSPVPDGTFLSTTWDASHKTAYSIGLHLNWVGDRTFHGMR